MSESRDVPAVALLFADAELGGHLREALTALGARIVHQGSTVDVSEAVLRDSGADVVVVNLEPADEERMEPLYAALEGGPYQVVFNDAEASRDLAGWHKARWARHLAAKLVGSSDVDPPRPVDARTVEVEAAATEPAAAAGVPAPVDAPVDLAAEDNAADAVAPAAANETGQSAQLEAELEALLVDSDASEAADDTDRHAVSGVDVEARQTVATPPPASDWELVDMTAAPSPAAAPDDPRQFGIDKVSAENYLKPDGGDQDDSSLEPGLELELVSLEESVAPTMADTAVSEMVLDAGAAGVRRAIIVGAGASGASALEIFLAGLPAGLPAVVLLLAPADGPAVETLAATLGDCSTLPLTLAGDGSRARHGSVLLVPPGQVCRLAHDGRVEWTAGQAMPGQSVVEQCLVDAADRLGTGVTAIMLAGADRGAMAGLRHVRDQGGQVWIQDPASCAGDPAVAAIRDDGLAVFVGSPVELARHLCEAEA